MDKQQVADVLVSLGFEDSTEKFEVQVWQLPDGQTVAQLTHKLFGGVFVLTPCLLEGDDLCSPAPVQSVDDVHESVRGF